jgi:hypothetical protein
LDNQFDNIPDQENEAFAHKYADVIGSKLKSRGIIPFQRIIDKKSIERDGLKLEWFIQN